MTLEKLQSSVYELPDRQERLTPRPTKKTVLLASKKGILLSTHQTGNQVLL